MSSVLSTQPAPVPVASPDPQVPGAAADLAPESLSAELAKLSIPQAAAMEILLRGGTAAARAADVSRQTIYDWLDPTAHFGQVHHTWKRSMAETARTRLLMLAEGATNVVATAIHHGDTKTAVKLLTGMGLLSTPPVGPSISEHQSQKAAADADTAAAQAVSAKRDPLNLGIPCPDEFPWNRPPQKPTS